MPIKDYLFDLSTKVLGTKTSSIDKTLDDAIQSINKYRTHSSHLGYVELLKRSIPQSQDYGNSIASSLGSFSQDMGPSTLGEGSRINRYLTYEGIDSKVTYCHRAINVITDNILSPDDITKKSVDVAIDNVDDMSDEKIQVEDIKEMLDDVKLDDKTELIVRNTLKYGDCFCEIADAQTALTSQSVLHEIKKRDEENGNKDNIIENLKCSIGLNKINENGLISNEQEKVDIDVTIDFSSLDEHTTNIEEEYLTEIDKSSKKKSKRISKKKKKDEMRKRDIYLIPHDPKFIVKLQSHLFGLCLGYLVFPKMRINQAQGQLGANINNVDDICLNILLAVEKKLGEKTSQDSNDDLKELLQTIIRKISTYRNGLMVRFVPPNKMEHFHKPSSLFAPYGESQYEPVQFLARLHIALEVAMTVFRISRSTEKRKILFEYGLGRDAMKHIESIKEVLRKRKVSIDSMGTIDDIPSNISTFEDIYIPQRNGKSFIDIQSFGEGNVDIRGRVEELKYIRDQIAAGMSIPGDFIGLHDNTSIKATLSEENILFARSIINHQKYFVPQLTSLTKKVFAIRFPEEELEMSNDINISLPPPKSLQFEREARYVGDITTLIRSLEEVGIPKEWSKKHYLSNFDWKSIEEHQTEDKIDKFTGEKEDDAAGGGFGGGAGGF